jgi:DNA-binding MarR family transcriptional regulator
MTHAQTPDLPRCASLPADAPITHELVHLFWLLSPAFMRWAESHMHQKDLTPQRVHLMLPLKERGPMTMGALRDELGVSATSITALVDALEKDAMVQRQPHPTDRRATLIVLTDKARQILDDTCADFKDRVSEIFNDFSPAQKTSLRDLLVQMRSALVQKNILRD